MTTAVRPPAPPAAGPPPARRLPAAPATATRRPPTGLPLDLVSELLQAAVTMAAVLAMRRLLESGDWVAQLALHTVAAHATVAVLRRLGVSTLQALLASMAIAFVVISWIHAPETTAFGIPTSTTIDTLRTAVADASLEFSEVKAPAPVLPGFVIGGAIGVWVSAILGDLATFRGDGPVESVLPSLALLVLAVVLGDGRAPALTVGTWFVAVLALVLVRRAARLQRTGVWVGDGAVRGPQSLVRLGVGLVVVAFAAALVVSPRLPGSTSSAVFDVSEVGNRGDGTRVTVSPLVDIRSRLVEQADVEVFTVRSDVRSYWRLTSLDRFDGRIWSSNGSYGKTSGELDEGVPTASARLTFSQQFRISALSQIWLPAAYEPVRVEVTEPVRYDEVSGTLIVDTEVPTSNGATYGVLSQLPQHDPSALATAQATAPADLAERYLALPADFSPRVADEARRVTAGVSTAYGAALALQNHFRSNFAYDLDIGPGHSTNAIESFLFDTRVGYCEQFAGTFAAMARSLGIPARVAVGFTPGVVDALDSNLYRVRGEHAHAWPEVFLGEYGWVAFEPTPGRGAPFAENYTGVPEQQAQPSAPEQVELPDSPPSTQAPSTTVPGQDPAGLPALPLPDDQALGSGDGDGGPSFWAQWRGELLLVLAAAAIATVTYVVAVLGLVRWRRAERRRRASSPEAQIGLAWAESVHAIRRSGVDVSDADTQTQTAARVAERLPSVAADVTTLAGHVESAAFSPTPPDPQAAATALALADGIETRLDAQKEPLERWRERLHPTNLRS